MRSCLFQFYLPNNRCSSNGEMCELTNYVYRESNIQYLFPTVGQCTTSLFVSAIIDRCSSSTTESLFFVGVKGGGGADLRLGEPRGRHRNDFYATAVQFLARFRLLCHAFLTVCTVYVLFLASVYRRIPLDSIFYYC